MRAAWEKGPRVLLRNVIIDREGRPEESHPDGDVRLMSSYSPAQALAPFVLTFCVVAVWITIRMFFVFDFDPGGTIGRLINFLAIFFSIAWVLVVLALATTVRRVGVNFISKQVVVSTSCLLLFHSRRAMCFSEIRYVRLQADSFGRWSAAPAWRVAVELNDGGRVSLTMPFFSGSELSSKEALCDLPRRACELSRLAGAPLLFSFEGVDTVVNSLEDTPELSDKEKAQVDEKLFERSSHYALYRIYFEVIAGIITIIAVIIGSLISKR